MLSFLRVKSGVEIRVHTVRAWTQRHDDSHGKVLLKLVFANAFNRVCRQTALTRTTSTFPGITRVGWLGATNIFRPFGLAQPPSSPRVGCNKGPPAVCRRYPRLNARSSSRAPGLSAFLPWWWHWCWRCGCGWPISAPGDQSLALRWTFQVRICWCWQRPARRLDWPFSGGATLNSSALLLEMMVLCTPPTSARWGSTASRSSVFPWGCPLLRMCASNGRMLHGMRCNSPHCQPTALQQFDSVVQAAFSSTTGLHLNPPLPSFTDIQSVFKFHPPASIHRPSVLILTSSFTSTPLASIHRPSVSIYALSSIPPPPPCFTDLQSKPGFHLFEIHLQFYHCFDDRISFRVEGCSSTRKKGNYLMVWRPILISFARVHVSWLLAGSTLGLKREDKEGEGEREDQKMTGCECRCDDAKVWGWKGVKSNRCEGEQMWRWEDKKMRRCEGVNMEKCEDEQMWNEKVGEGGENDKVWRWDGAREGVNMKWWRWEDEIQSPHYWQEPCQDLGKIQIPLLQIFNVYIFIWCAKSNQIILKKIIINKFENKIYQAKEMFKQRNKNLAKKRFQIIFW